MIIIIITIIIVMITVVMIVIITIVIMIIVVLIIVVIMLVYKSALWSPQNMSCGGPQPKTPPARGSVPPVLLSKCLLPSIGSGSRRS